MSGQGQTGGGMQGNLGSGLGQYTGPSVGGTNFGTPGMSGSSGGQKPNMTSGSVHSGSFGPLGFNPFTSTGNPGSMPGQQWGNLGGNMGSIPGLQGQGAQPHSGMQGNMGMGGIPPMQGMGNGLNNAIANPPPQGPQGMGGMASHIPQFQGTGQSLQRTGR